MQIPVQQLPVVEGMSPYHQALGSALQNYSNSANAAFAVPKMASDINYKNTLSGYMPYSNISKLLSNPQVVSQMTPDQLQSYLNFMRTMPTNPNGSQTAQATPEQPGLLKQIWNKVMGSDQTQPVTQPATQSGGMPNDGSVNQNTQMPEVDSNGQPLSREAIAQKQLERARLQQTGNVMTGQGKGVGGGTTFVNPNSGESFSSATPQATSAVQTTLLTTQRVAPYVKDLPDQYEKSYGLGNTINKGIEGVESFISGGKVKTPTLSAQGRYKTDLTNAADGFLKELNLNNTTGNRQSMEAALRAAPGESPENYRERINWLWNTIKERDEVGKQFLFQGIQLNPNLVKTEEGRKMLESTNTLKSSMENPSGSWPQNKEAVNASEFEGKAPPKDSVWMIRPDGVQVVVHNSNLDKANALQYRGLS